MPSEELEKEEQDDDDDIGLVIWPSARTMLRWLTGGATAGSAPEVVGKTLLELGAGTGFLAKGLIEAGVGRMFAFEGSAAALENMRKEMQALEGRICPMYWNWEESTELPADVPLEEVDLVIGTDLVYLGTAEAELAAAFAALLRSDRAKKGLRALILLCDRPPGGEQFLPNPRPDSGTRAVDRFLGQLAVQELSVRELRLPEDMEVPDLSDYRERLDRARGETLRLFELTSGR
mmetsp:Transcript_131245/g.419866  ORF Transcript_131245/g.419866 Transcript_131245/m.419866 type:complete len:234 (-) Transcript_131245:13-714(-)